MYFCVIAIAVPRSNAKKTVSVKRLVNWYVRVRAWMRSRVRACVRAGVGPFVRRKRTNDANCENVPGAQFNRSSYTVNARVDQARQPGKAVCPREEKENTDSKPPDAT